nr:DUF4062 domain-containing protein [Paenibacillus ehimensis]
MKKKLQIYISSTFADLVAERQIAVEAILKAGHIPAGIGIDPFFLERPMDTIKRWIMNPMYLSPFSEDSMETCFPTNRRVIRIGNMIMPEH